MYIKEKLDRMKALQRDAKKIASVVMMDTSEDFLNILRDQMLHGIDGNNQSYEYAIPAYAAMKERMNPLANGAVDLKLTGDFQNELTLRVLSQNKYDVYSQDWKNSILIKRYGKDIMATNEENTQKYRREYFMPEFKKSASELING